MSLPKTLSLTFDFEECDLPREFGVDFSLEEGMAVSKAGAEAILALVERQKLRATFFCTLNFAMHAPEIMRRLVEGGHEIAAHGVDHWQQTAEDPARAKEGLERLLPGVKIVGYRQPRMFPVDDGALVREGYEYNSSLNPAVIPGRYWHWRVPRTPFVKEGLLQVPSSVTPHLRIPLFWLALHLFPEGLYRHLVRRTLRHDGWVVTYFHPWEFFPLGEHPQWRIPWMIRRHAGADLVGRLERFVEAMKAEGVVFETIQARVAQLAACERGN